MSQTSHPSSALGTAASSPTQAFFFGPTGRRLFGIHHKPLGQEREGGIVLCYPMGEEHIRAHPYFVQLAFQLATAGFNVLRFDCFGCGDSDGDFEAASLDDWTSDISLAVEELHRRCGKKTVGLVGLRLGASLITLAARSVEHIRGAILWEPVVDGALHVRDLLARHTEWMRGSFATEESGIVGGEQGVEVMGFPLSAKLRGQIEDVDLRRIARAPAPEILLLSASGERPVEELEARLQDLGARITRRSIPNAAVWLKQEAETGKGLAALRTLRAIVHWTREVLR